MKGNQNPIHMRRVYHFSVTPRYQYYHRPALLSRPASCSISDSLTQEQHPCKTFPGRQYVLVPSAVPLAPFLNVCP
jgi:hypothetical protein